MAIKDIGGVARERVPKGTVGYVTKAGWGETRVLFTVTGVFGDKKVEIQVEKGEVA